MLLLQNLKSLQFVSNCNLNLIFLLSDFQKTKKCTNHEIPASNNPTPIILKFKLKSTESYKLFLFIEKSQIKLWIQKNIMVTHGYTIHQSFYYSEHVSFTKFDGDNDPINIHFTSLLNHNKILVVFCASKTSLLEYALRHVTKLKDFSIEKLIRKRRYIP